MRDGLQNERTILSLPDKLTLLTRLSDMNPYCIEVTSFVRKDLVPQLSDANELCKEMFNYPQMVKARKKGVLFSGLVRNCFIFLLMFPF